MTELVDVVRWEQPSDLVAVRRIELLGSVGGDLATALTDLGPRFAREDRAARARAMLDELDDATLVRILGAPEVCRTACQYHVAPTAELLDQVEAWFAVEAVLGDPQPVLDAPAWSALGDRRIPGRACDAPDDWGVAGAVIAAETHAGIVVDFDSPAARRTPKSADHREIKLEAPVPMPADERQISLDKIDQALTALAEACPPAYQFVTGMVRVIMPRRDRVRPEFYTSSSVRTTIGRMVLNNPYQPNVSVAQLAGSLVHEAIHAYLYIEERAEPLVTDWDEAYDRTVASPWTGGLLSVATYIHACFVWHGLRALWRQPAMAARFGDSVAGGERARADRGFAGQVTAGLAESQHIIPPRIWNALERMSDA